MTVLHWMLSTTVGLAVHTFVGAIIVLLAKPWWCPKGMPISAKFVAALSVAWPLVVMILLMVLYFILFIGLPMKAANYVVSRREAQRAMPPMGR